MRIRLTLGQANAVARLYDNPTARDFASLLPVTITLHDLALYYHQDDFAIPSPGIVMIGEIESGLDTLTATSDNDTLTIAAAD